MTKEEAETLKPGDIISCAGDSNRVLTKVWIIREWLHWNQKGRGDAQHEYSIVNITIVKRAKEIIDTYDIY